jgi:RNA polymerase sigma-70 factor (ECF subfamily)
MKTLINSGKIIVSNGGENSLQLKEILKAIYQLPQIFKIPFLLYFEGYRYHEISESLNEPLGTIKSRIHFGRKLLKEQLSRY